MILAWSSENESGHNQMYVWHGSGDAIPWVRFPSNSNGRARGGPRPLLHGGVGGFWIPGCVQTSGFWSVEMWEMRKLSLSCVLPFLACILARACSRAGICLFSIGSNRSFVEDKVSGRTKEESLAGKYTEGSELVLALQKMPIVYLSLMGLVLDFEILF